MGPWSRSLSAAVLGVATVHVPAAQAIAGEYPQVTPGIAVGWASDRDAHSPTWFDLNAHYRLRRVAFEIEVGRYSRFAEKRTPAWYREERESESTVNIGANVLFYALPDNPALFVGAGIGAHGKPGSSDPYIDPSSGQTWGGEDSQMVGISSGIGGIEVGVRRVLLYVGTRYDHVLQPPRFSSHWKVFAGVRLRIKRN